jgi:hypothetical protein
VEDGPVQERQQALHGDETKTRTLSFSSAHQTKAKQQLSTSSLDARRRGFYKERRLAGQRCAPTFD